MNPMKRTAFFIVLIVMIAVDATAGGKKTGSAQSLEEYLRRLPTAQHAVPGKTAGGLWDQNSAFTELISDSRARRLSDPVVVRLTAQTIAQASGSVSSKRNYEASSGIDAVAGKMNTSGIQALFSPRSKSKLEGQAQTATESSLKSTLTGQVVAVLDGGLLVVEARRSILLNDQRETAIVRGLVRSSDIGADNTISSTLMSNLEIELKGKGVISDSTRPPNWLVRTIMKVLLF